MWKTNRKRRGTTANDISNVPYKMFPDDWPLRTNSTAAATTITTVPSDKSINKNAVQLNIWLQLYENLCKSKPSDDCVASNIKRPQATAAAATRSRKRQQRQPGCRHTSNIEPLQFAFNCCDYLGLLHTLVSPTLVYSILRPNPSPFASM